MVLELGKKYAKNKHIIIKIVELENAPQPPIEVQKGASRYCLDNLDCEWLKLANEHRTAAGLSRLTESDLEIIIHEFETQANSSIRNVRHFSSKEYLPNV